MGDSPFMGHDHIGAGFLPFPAPIPLYGDHDSVVQRLKVIL